MGNGFRPYSPKRRVVVVVSNDLSTDQRVNKVCLALVEAGWEVCLLGRKLPNSSPLNRSYRCVRLPLWFKKGFLFYAEFNVRVFWWLLFKPFEVLHSNDLDTLWPCYVVSGWRRKPLVYDTHEYFVGVPELQNRPWVKAVWKGIEKRIFPKLKYVFTVNSGIAALYQKDYGVLPRVVRNISPKQLPDVPAKARADFGLSEEAFLLINQGTGINVDRGMEELFEALCLLPARFQLVLVGKGDVWFKLQEMAQTECLRGRVHFFDARPYAEMLSITRLCDLGVSLDKNTNLNYRFSLPNKIFDFIRMGLPVLASNLPEVKKIVEDFNVGKLCASHEPRELAKCIEEMELLGKKPFDEALKVARENLYWEQEVLPMQSLYKNL